MLTAGLRTGFYTDRGGAFWVFDWKTAETGRVRMYAKPSKFYYSILLYISIHCGRRCDREMKNILNGRNIDRVSKWRLLLIIYIHFGGMKYSRSESLCIRITGTTVAGQLQLSASTTTKSPFDSVGEEIWFSRAMSPRWYTRVFSRGVLTKLISTGQVSCQT